MVDRLRGSEVLSGYESRAKELAKKVFAKYNPDKGDFFEYQEVPQRGYAEKNFSMMIESANPDDRLIVILVRNWEGGVDARHTMITVGKYDESRFLAGISERILQIQMDVLDQSWEDDSQDAVRFDWDKKGCSAWPENVTTEKADELLSMAEKIIQGDPIVHLTELKDENAYR